MVIKYSSNGEAEWAEGIGGADSDYINSVVECRNGGYIVGGRFKSSSISLKNGISLINKGSDDGMVIKLNGYKVLGIAFYNIYDYEVTPKITFNFKEGESGASAGFMTSLAIYDTLIEKDLTHGLKIAGTGTIDLHAAQEKIIEKETALDKELSQREKMRSEYSSKEAE